MKAKPNRPRKPANHAGGDRHRARKAGPQTDWAGVADWYDQLVGDKGSEYQQEVVFPGVLRLLGPVAGENILDLACGQGAFCRLLREKDAQVTGIDAARPLIQVAQQRSDPAIRYRVADALRLTEMSELAGRFDAVVCVLAIQNINPLDPIFQGVAACLAPGGRFVLAMMHPAFRGPHYTSWGWEEHKVQYRRVDRYLLPRKEPIVTNPGKDATRFTWTFHRPLQTYIKSLARAGLLVNSLEEWPSHKQSEPGPRAKAENTARKEIPLFMAIRAVKAKVSV
jgi:2-polyprenyl-3-methyl-5-hydroxy-6-metoxy-1,4-benzoquinol methylase